MYPAYTEEELKRFEEELAAREAELNARAQRLSQETEALGRSQDRLEAQKRELQQVTSGGFWAHYLDLLQLFSLSKWLRSGWPIAAMLIIIDTYVQVTAAVIKGAEDFSCLTVLRQSFYMRAVRDVRLRRA